NRKTDVRVSTRCPLHPQKRTSPSAVAMSALCQKRTSVRFGGRGLQDVVRQHRPTNSLQCKLANSLECYRFIDGLPNARADKDLTGLGFIAQAGGDVRDSANCRIIPPTLESNRSQGRKAMRDANAEAKVMAKIAPFLINPPIAARISSAIRTACSAGFSTGTRSLKMTMTPSPAYRSSVPPYLMMILPN